MRPFLTPARKWLGIAAIVLFATTRTLNCAAQDRVWHQPPQRSSAESKWLPQSLLSHSGTITEVDDDTVRIQPANGDLVNLALDRVIWWEPDWQDEAATQGMADATAGRYAEAIPQLLKAVQAAPPVWQQQWLTGHLALSAAEAEKYPAALELIAQLARSKPPTPVLSLLPIRWTSRPTSPAAIAAAREAISADEPLARLVAASWLLSDPTDRPLAERTLDALTNDRTQAWLPQLAAAVRWRRTPVPQIEKLADKWLEDIDRMPIALQGGPLLCVADRLQASGAKEKSHDLYLAVSLLYQNPRVLSDSAKQALGE